MFGYVVVNKPELKIKEFDIYKGYYCGLCNALRKRHGITGQLTLTYDMTFLTILLSSLYEPDITDEMHRCIVHPMSRHRMISSKFTDYTADMNVLLAYHKAKDDWEDEHNVLKLAFSKLLQNKTNNYERKSSTISSLLHELGTREKENETDIDVMAGIFGKIMAEVFAPQEDQWTPHLKKMGFFLGKFIYILDAYDDLESHLKKNQYNPFKSICTEPGFDDRIKTMLTMMMAECSKTFEFLPVLDNAELLRNILYAGVWSVYYKHIKDKQ